MALVLHVVVDVPQTPENVSLMQVAQGAVEGVLNGLWPETNAEHHPAIACGWHWDMCSVLSMLPGDWDRSFP